MDDVNNIEINNNHRKSIWPWIILVTALVVFGVYFYNNLLKNPCRIPVKFVIGNVDPKFKLSADDVKGTSKDAADRWNAETGDSVLEYDSSATLKINLVYDERQAKVDQLNSEVAGLDASGNAIDTARSKLETMVASYQSDLNNYNSTVSYWNAKGGAPTNIYDQLQSEKAELEARRNQINNYSSLINSEISDQNSNIDQVNTEIEAEKNKIITQGLYYPSEDKIDVFTFGNKEELRLVLMHELGHALSLGHDAINTSVMYPILGDQNLSDPTLSSEDLSMYDSVCKSTLGPIKLLFQKLFHPAASTS